MMDLLNTLSEAGGDYGSDYHDGLDGWFGWQIRKRPIGLVLTVSFEPAGEDKPGPLQEEHYLLTSYDDGKS